MRGGVAAILDLYRAVDERDERCAATEAWHVAGQARKGDNVTRKVSSPPLHKICTRKYLPQ